MARKSTEKKTTTPKTLYIVGYKDTYGDGGYNEPYICTKDDLSQGFRFDDFDAESEVLEVTVIKRYRVKVPTLTEVLKEIK